MYETQRTHYQRVQFYHHHQLKGGAGQDGSQQVEKDGTVEPPGNGGATQDLLPAGGAERVVEEPRLPRCSGSCSEPT